MNVYSASNLSAVNKPQSFRVTQADQTPQDTVNKSVSDSVSISEQAHKMNENWQTIASQYDVHSIYGDEIRSLSKELFEGGFISRGEMMAIGAPTSMNELPNQKHDLLNDMKHTYKLSTSLGAHNSGSSEVYLNAIDVLTRLEQTRTQ